MKILQVTNFFKPSWEAGGPVRATYEISKSLVQDGHDVTVYTTDGFKHRLDVIKNKPVSVDGIKTYYFRNLSLCLSKNMNLPIPYYLPVVLKKEIKNFDVIHIHEYRTFLAVLIHYYAKKYNIPYVLQPRGSMPLLGKSNQKKIFDYFFGNSLVKDAKLIIASSKVESSHYLGVFPCLDQNKIVHVPNGLNIQDYCNLSKKGEFRKKYSINENEKIILFLGRIHEIKGLNILVEAFYNLVKYFGGVKLVVAGPDDGYLTKLKVIIEDLGLSDNIIFTGPLYESEKIEAYVDADIFVLPSMYESFGNVVLEAIACGTPIIVTDRCGVSEWISDFGYIVEFDATQLRNAMFTLFTDKSQYNNFSRSCQNALYSSFSWDSVAEQMGKIYDHIIREEL